MSEEKSALVAILEGLGNIKIPCDWSHRIRDGLLYATGSGITLLLVFSSGVLGIFLLLVWWFFTVQAIKRLSPGFFGSAEYTVYKIKKQEAEQQETPHAADIGAKKVATTQTSIKAQPTSEEFWAAQRAREALQSTGAPAPTCSPRLVAVSYPKRSRESAKTDRRSRTLLEVLAEVAKPLPVALSLDGLPPLQEALIEPSVVDEHWQPLVEFANCAKQQATNSCDLKSLRQVSALTVYCDLKMLLAPISGVSVEEGYSFAMEIKSNFGPIDRDGFCDAVAMKGGENFPFVHGLIFESTLEGALAAFFIQVVLPGQWAWGHGMYDRNQQLVTTLDSAETILRQSGISTADPQLRKLTAPPGIRVSRIDDTVVVGCLAYWPGKGFSDIAVTIKNGKLSEPIDRTLFHWSQGILY